MVGASSFSASIALRFALVRSGDVVRAMIIVYLWELVIAVVDEGRQTEAKEEQREQMGDKMGI